MPEPRYIYWDTDVFLSYLNNDPDRLPVIDAILEAVESSKNDKIVTSVVAKVKVTWVAHEKLKRILSKDEETRIDDMWNNSEVIELIDFSDEIALKARQAMREGMVKGWKLRTNDDIHLASALRVGVVELQTYNLRDFQKFSQV